MKTEKIVCEIKAAFQFYYKRSAASWTTSIADKIWNLLPVIYAEKNKSEGYFCYNLC